jgi:exodeoxyribonuclease VII large subunit
MDRVIYSVSRLTRDIKDLLETTFPRLWVEGEISNVKQHSSGHLYFILKDENAQIRCAMWRFQAGNLLFRPEDGLKVVIEADLQVYERGGNYQLVVYQIHPAGIGELQLAFEQMKKRLQSEGLFDESHKKSIPLYPERIGIVTSPTGAALRDIISVISGRYPGIQLILNPVRVQGEGAANEIAVAIEEFNQYGQVDLLIVGRGGGSLEDLWAFNEEKVARAIFQSHIPIVTAIGHEIDYTIADFVADRRAPTPSAAGEMVVKDYQELVGVLAYYQEKFSLTLLRKLTNYRERILNLKKSYAFRRPQDIVYQKMQQLDEQSRKIQLATQYLLRLKTHQLSNLCDRLRALSPLDVLKRGYSICYKDGQIVKDIAQINIEDMVKVKLYKGDFESKVKKLGDKL